MLRSAEASSSLRSPRDTEALSSRRLLIAIIRRAVLDFVVYRFADPVSQPEQYALAVDAVGWLFWDGIESEDAEGRYTFGYICLLLELDARKIRERALTLTRDEVQKISNSSGES